MHTKTEPARFCRMRGVLTGSPRSATLREKLGSVCLVSTAFGLAFIELGAMAALERGHLVWSAVWMALFPLVIPSTPKRALANALVGASMSPAAFAVLVLLGRTSLLPASELVLLLAPVYVAAFVAFLVSRTLNGLGARAEQVEKLGMYELEARIAQGGMGEVWRAKHQLLTRPAAIKLIKPNDGEGPAVDALALRRFEREAQVTASLRSPHTVQLYDFGITRSGSFYYVMELLEGTDLENLVREQGPLESRLVVHILEQALDSLSEAHSHGLVHRDIKPANLHLSERGLEKNFVVVLDFGLVKAEATAGEANVSLTQAGRITGTPAYLAPEIATGRGKVDGRADLYALGCVAYYLLTGKLVFEGATAMQVALAHAVEAPIPPSQRIGRPIPRDLERIILRCLEKDPEQRPQSARELLEMLQGIDWTAESSLRRPGAATASSPLN
jgi:eukaryotic-like serine/threonine-protein kinase